MNARSRPEAASESRPDQSTNSNGGGPRPTKTCRYHCGGCGRHFTSEAAFDAHRVGDHSKPNGHPEGRRCLAIEDDARFTGVEGRCEMYRESLAGTIYGLARDRARASAYFEGQAPQALAAESG